MSVLVKFALVLFGLAYLISPVDLMPDLLLPWLGWIDDGLIAWSIYYLIRYGELPWSLFKKKAGNRFPGSSPGAGRKTSDDYQQTQRDRSTGTDFNNEKKPNEILGVSINATQQEIHAAYKEKIKLYHPDKLSHLGPEFTDLANKKFLEIQAAYDAMKRRY